jgi:hypothetical protein
MFYSISATDSILSIKQVGLSMGNFFESQIQTPGPHSTRFRFAVTRSRQALDFAIGFANESNRGARDDKFGEMPFGTA